MAVLLSLPPFFGILLCILLLIVTSKTEDAIDAKTTLSNGKKLLLIGIGVGNLQHEKIVDMISMASNDGIRLIDTAHASRNEHLVNQGIEKSVSNDVHHVITKVWYTHLGYERTKLSVEESLAQLHAPNIKVHLLLHWPRCRRDIPWMDCQGEEERLSQQVKNAGPPPHLDNNAFVESWRALEDLYESNGRIESVGVSNFDMNDFKTLEASSRITPHVLQGNVWTFLFDPYLMRYLQQHDIHFQAYNVMNGIFSQSSKAPNAYHSLVTLASTVSEKSNHVVATPSQVVLKWLTQNNVSVIPRTSDPQHLQENSAFMTVIPSDLTPKQCSTVQNAVAALLRGVDLDPPKVTFYNRANQIAHLFWKSDDQEEVPVKEHLQPNESFESQTYPGHVFVAYDESKSNRREYEISANYGDAQEFHIEL